VELNEFEFRIEHGEDYGIYWNYGKWKHV
jgi:hypothetical protein